MANEELASKMLQCYKIGVFSTFVENNLALQEPLYQLRAETKDAYDEARALEARWRELEKEQREVYQVPFILHASASLNRH